MAHDFSIDSRSDTLQLGPNTHANGTGPPAGAHRTNLHIHPTATLFCNFRFISLLNDVDRSGFCLANPAGKFSKLSAGRYL